MKAYIFTDKILITVY